MTSCGYTRNLVSTTLVRTTASQTYCAISSCHRTRSANSPLLALQGSELHSADMSGRPRGSAVHPFGRLMTSVASV
jgi:hypothetical protein